MKTTFNNSSWVSAEAGCVSLKEACCVMVCGAEVPHHHPHHSAASARPAPCSPCSLLLPCLPCWQAHKQHGGHGGRGKMWGMFRPMAAGPANGCMAALQSSDVCKWSQLRKAPKHTLLQFKEQPHLAPHNLALEQDEPAWSSLALPGRSYASFRAGNTVEFELRAKELSCISQVAVRMVPTDTDPTWHLDSVQVVVVTGGQADAGFDGEAHVVLGGSWGSSVETQLVNSASAFEPGSSQQFDIKATDVDRLQTLSLRAVATGTSSQWFVEQVAVTHAGKGTTTVFNLNAWVKPDEPQTLKAVLPDTEYKLSVVTASDSTDSFDGRVLVSCCGLDGSVEEQQLLLPDGGKPVFAPGSSTTVGFKAGDVGGIQWVMLRLEEGSDPAASWKLDRLELQVVRSGFTTTLSCGRCLCVGESMYLYPQSTVNYKLTVKTSRQLGAAFDGEVRWDLTPGRVRWGLLAAEAEQASPAAWHQGEAMWLHRAAWRELIMQFVRLLNDKGADAFAQGAAEDFLLPSYEVTWVTQATVRVVASGKERRWHLAHLELSQPDQTWNNTQGFVHNDWLGGDAGDSVTLAVATGQPLSSMVLALRPDSEPFDGAVWLMAQSSEGKARPSASLSLQSAPAQLSAGALITSAARTVCLDAVCHGATCHIGPLQWALGVPRLHHVKP
ncbi:uncharacterized protein HaLaN_03787 [Haematococcus lacustris]|uniref:PLAT domain-containing protein n=1 Tax=Haematococcus lacustris TaxID=44745 RepID=A0A699YF97_HAELA|nr:uncharacterized protein HaLaN_03787 [Haematococcus lacustris]